MSAALDRYSEHFETIGAIGDFLDWLRDQEQIDLVRISQSDTLLRGFPMTSPVFAAERSKLILKYFDIDPAQLEKERQALLSEARTANGLRADGGPEGIIKPLT